MTRLSDTRIAQLAHDAGWFGADLTRAVAIALAESAGDPDAIGDVNLENATWGPSVGLWQIRSLVHERGTGGVRDEVANHDPVTNARHAHTIYAWSCSFHPWSTFNNGRYQQFWSRAVAAVDSLAHGRILHRYLLLLRHWQTGADVTHCQQIVKCRPDGIFGPITKEHVITWQRGNHLLVDGIVGPQTAHSFGWVWAGPAPR